jgi:hypothetical protein
MYAPQLSGKYAPLVLLERSVEGVSGKRALALDQADHTKFSQHRADLVLALTWLVADALACLR